MSNLIESELTGKLLLKVVFPIILLGKQFGAFPFNHGMVGGTVSTGRHGPHAAHGKDIMSIQAKSYRL